MSTYIPSCPSLHFKDSCGRPWNYCSPPTLSTSYLGASWSGSYPLILLTPIAYRSCSAPFDSSPTILICTHSHIISTAHYTLALAEEIANVTKSSRADCQVCADGRAQTVTGQDQCSQQDASKIALRYVLAVSALQ